MQDFAKLKLIRNISRTFCTCNVNLKSYAAREAKFLTRIMRGEQHAKRQWYPNAEVTARNAEVSVKTRQPQNTRRNVVLNKLFMKYITDLLATGEVAPEIVGKGIEISRVNVTSDFSRVNVFWLATDSGDADKRAEEALNKAAGPLRHELSQLRVIGIVPLIKFVRDKQYIKEVEIDKRLAIADFGEDYVPTDHTLRLRSTPVLNSKLSPDVWNDIEKLELETLDSEPEIVEDPLPEMRNDVFGLDRTRIMATIQSSMDKSRAAYVQRSLNIVSPIPSAAEGTSTVVEYLSAKQKSEMFSAFLTKRELDVKRRLKIEKKMYRDQELVLIEEKNEPEDNDEIFDVDYHSNNFQLK